MTKMLHLWAALILCCLGTQAGATDRYVDWNLSAGDGVTTFATIADAVAAAENGDRILILPGIYAEPVLTIDKSLALMPSEEGGVVQFNAVINISGLESGDTEMYAFDTGVYDVNVTNPAEDYTLTFVECDFNALLVNSSGNHMVLTALSSVISNITISGNGGNMTPGERSEFHCIENTVSGSITNDVDGWDPRIIRTSVGAQTTIRCGDVVMCTMPRLVVNDESGGNSADVRMAIIQNEFSDYVEFRNDNHLVRMANNQMKNLYWFMWNHTSGSNDIINNEFVTNAYIHFPWNPPGWAHRFYNNIFGTTYFMRWATDYAYWDNTNFNWCDTDNDSGCNTNTDVNDQRWNGDGIPPFGNLPCLYDCNQSNCNYSATDFGCGVNFWSTGTAAFPNPAYGGFFEWNHNNIELPQPAQGGGDALVYEEQGNGGPDVDGGSPAHEFYDLDLTLNDRGRAGGPWGTANFPADTDAKALIYDLEMPADLYPGQDVEIRAKAYQRN